MKRVKISFERYIDQFETNQCHVSVMKTRMEDNYGNLLYIITSTHKKDGKVLVRFGTKSQIDQMIKTYKKEKKFEL